MSKPPTNSKTPRPASRKASAKATSAATNSVVNASLSAKPVAAPAIPEPILAVRPAGSLGSARGALQQRMGQLTLAMLRLPRYRHLPLGDLDILALRPLLNDRVAFAHGEGDDTSEVPIGMAIWASVSDAVSERIAGQVNSGVFPLRLGKDEWTSGENVWLLDVIVPNKRAGTAVFVNFGSMIGGRSFRMHPVVLKSVDRQIVDKIANLGQGMPVATAPTTH